MLKLGGYYERIGGRVTLREEQELFRCEMVQRMLKCSLELNYLQLPLIKL